MCMHMSVYTSMHTVFAQSDATATNRERCLKSFVNVRALRTASFIRSTKNYGDLILKQNFQLLDQSSLSYKAVPTWHLQSVSSLSSCNDFTP